MVSIQSHSSLFMTDRSPDAESAAQAACLLYEAVQPKALQTRRVATVNDALARAARAGAGVVGPQEDRRIRGDVLDTFAEARGVAEIMLVACILA